MLAGTDPKLIYEWQAYYQLEPFGEERADIRNAITCLTIAGTFGMKKKGGKDFELKDFMPSFDETNRSDKTELTALKAQGLMKSLYGYNRKSGSKPNS
jgi:hypothetical protein